MKLYQKLQFLSKLLYRRTVLTAKAKIKLIDGDLILLSFKDDKGFYLPYSSKKNIDHRQIFMVSVGLSEWLKNKYTLPSIKPKVTDTVIDCGAFVGGFSIAAAQMGVKKVISVEPSSKNFRCLNYNIEHYNYDGIITPLNIGLGEKKSEMQLNLSESGCEDSFLTPDEGDLNISETVQINTLDNLIDDHQLAPAHLYVKIEAEGFEPEIVKGLKRHKPRVMVLDITPERDQMSPKEEIKNYLNNIGYETKETDRCLFAFNNESK